MINFQSVAQIYAILKHKKNRYEDRFFIII